MSTTFGIEIEGEMTKIARRVGGSNGAEMYFTNSLVEALPDETPVEPLDNTAQGIFTIGDIRKHIKKQNKVTKYNLDHFFKGTTPDDLPF